jgi:hypothetical protein
MKNASREWFVVVTSSGHRHHVVEGVGPRRSAVGADPNDALTDRPRRRALTGWRKRENAVKRVECRRHPQTGKLTQGDWSVRLYYFDEGTNEMVPDPEQPASQ